MAATEPINQCLDIPIDHRLRHLLYPGPPISDPHAQRGKHVQTLEQYGRRLKSDGEKISLLEIEFATSLAKPDTKGGVLILLQQPAPNQQYDGRSFDTIVDECETLKAVDNVLRAVIGTTLRETSCFDAFPFQKTPIPNRSPTAYVEYEEAYKTCMAMISQKQPDIVLCCYRDMGGKFNFLCSRGVGRQYPDKYVKLEEGYCLPINAFHPSFAINYNKGESRFRTLYMLEMLRAFHEAHGTWKDSSWMDKLRLECTNRTIALLEEKTQNPDIQVFDRWERSFQDGIAGLKKHVDHLSGLTISALSENGWYSLMTDMTDRDSNIAWYACDCLLVLTFLKKNSASGARDGPARDARAIARKVKQTLLNFLFDTLKGPFKTVKKELGLVDNRAIESFARSLKIPIDPGNQRSVKMILKTLMTDLNKCCSYESANVYGIDLVMAEKAFSGYAHQLEDVLETHLALTAAPRIEITALSDKLSSLEIASERYEPSLRPQFQAPNTPRKQAVVTVTQVSPKSDMACFGCGKKGHFKDECLEKSIQTVVTITALSPKASMACFGCGQPGHFRSECPQRTPEKQTIVATRAAPAKTAMNCYGCGEPGHFRDACPQRTPQRSSITTPLGSPSGYTRTCSQCSKPGHWKGSCPMTKCYRCNGFGHFSSACPKLTSTPRS